MKLKVVAFDLDGVIINSLKNMEYSWDNTSKKNNLNINFNKFKKYIGLPFDIILGKLNIKRDLNKIKKSYIFYSNQKISKIKLYPKIISIIKRLKKKYLISIITSKDLTRSKKIIKHFKIPCDFLIAPEMVCKGKPHEDSILLLKKKFQINSNNVIFIGDTKIDYNFAKNSKIKFLFASWGYGEIMKGCKKIKEPKDILKIL
jgi:HAD superfamily hydrolase (TIGR01549 family)